MKRTLSIILCILILVSGCISRQDKGNGTEATEYMGIKLTPISEQGNNAIKGTQFIDKDAYILQIDGYGGKTSKPHV